MCTCVYVAVNSLPLKSVLETVLAVGNYLNGASERGQADGFRLDILNKLKDFVDRVGSVRHLAA